MYLHSLEGVAVAVPGVAGEEELEELLRVLLGARQSRLQEIHIELGKKQSSLLQDFDKLLSHCSTPWSDMCGENSLPVVIDNVLVCMADINSSNNDC